MVKKPAKKRKVSRPKKKVSRKPVQKKAVKKVQKAPTVVGLVTHFYPNICVAVVETRAPLKQGDTVTVMGHEQSFKQKIASMQIEHKQVKEAKKGQTIGLKVDKPVKENDLLYK